MKNIICIDLTKYTLDELKEVSKVFNVPFFYLEDMKGNPGEDVYFAKVWFDTLNQEIVGYSSISDKDKFVLTGEYTVLMADTKPVELKVVSIEDLKNMLNESISNEDYESATEIRDKINKLKVSKVSQK
jgi:hypothetical protein